MASIQPLKAVQTLLRLNPQGRPVEILGSCFRLWAPRRYVTASHCVAGLEPGSVAVMNSYDPDHDLPASSITHHPKADIAVVEVSGEIPSAYTDLYFHEWGRDMGGPVWCYGIVCGPETGPREMFHRGLSGTIQRAFQHSVGPYSSEALEYSEPIPKGMSGAPAILLWDPPRAIGVALGTLDSELVVQRYEEREEHGVRYREKVIKVAQYGVILRLDSVKPWLLEVLGTV